MPKKATMPLDPSEYLDSEEAMEAVDAKPKKITRERIAAAIGLSLEQVS